jgi:hypothetical protein
VYILYFLQGNHLIYVHIRCKYILYTVLANPRHHPLAFVRFSHSKKQNMHAHSRGGNPPGASNWQAGVREAAAVETEATTLPNNDEELMDWIEV